MTDTARDQAITRAKPFSTSQTLRERPVRRLRVQLPPFEEFQHKFLQAFGREITREERRFYRLITIILEEEHLGIGHDQTVAVLREVSADVIGSARRRKRSDSS